MNLQENINRIKSLLLTETSFSDIPPKNLSIIDKAKTQLGVPYKWGAEKPDIGFDCSGLISYVADLPRLDANKYFKTIPKIDKKNLRPGDIIFFGVGTASHVGIITDVDENGNVKEMIHARGREKCPGNKPTKDKYGRPDCVVQKSTNISWYKTLGYGRVKS